MFSKHIEKVISHFCDYFKCRNEVSEFFSSTHFKSKTCDKFDGPISNPKI